MGQTLFSHTDWPRVAALFDQAQTLPPSARPGWLAQLQATEPHLAQQVQHLLGAQAQHDTLDWLERGPGDDWLAPGHEQLAPGAVLGRYRLLRHVASGGMGEVWLATAVQGPAERSVALKLPLLGRDLSRARFEREGALLARLVHPHIAQLLDAGTAADGRPYIALEWVDGAPLLAWCAQHRLGLRERIGLFLQVADAVAHAHAQLVLHRDIKPSNVLVDQHGQAKLLDFGIAKLLDDGTHADATELTRLAGPAMTSTYAAPEQLQGQRLTPATDVYALGVLLFELLTGARPYRTQLDTRAQIEQAIVNADVRRPSSLLRTLRGDIDAIVAKAMQREPTARYPAVQALADDLRRHLQGRPVQARPDSLVYLATRLLQRHRVATLGVLATACALVAGAVLTGLQAQRADRERDQAVAAQQRSEATHRFMLDLLDDAAKAGRPLSAPELMARAEALGRRTLAHKPDQLAAVLAIAGSELSASRDTARGATLLAEAAALARAPALRAELDCRATAAGTAAGRGEAAKQRLQQRVGETGLDEGTRAVCRLLLAQLLIQRGDTAEAAPLLQAAYQHYTPQGTEAWRELAQVVAMQTYLSATQPHQGAGADARVERTLHVLHTLGRERSAAAQGLYNTWGTLALVSGEPRKAAERYSHLVQLIEQDSGPQAVAPYHLNMLANAYTAQGALDEAAALLERSAAMSTADHGGAARFTAACLRARVAALQGDAATATAWFERALAVPDRGEPLRRNAQPLCDLARAEAAVLTANAPAEQVSIWLAPWLAAQAPPSLRLAALLVQAEAQLAQGDAAAAKPTAREAVRLAQTLQADNRHSARTGQALVLQALAESRTHQPQTAHPTSHPPAQLALQHLQATVLPQQRWHQLASQLATPQAGR